MADDQLPPSLSPEYAGEPGLSSLRWDSDLLYISPCTDVIAEATAHAPGGRASRKVDVSLRVGPVEKRLRVYGKRTYYQGVMGLAMTAPEPFVAQPIRYEESYGGIDFAGTDSTIHAMDARNPIGRGFATDPSRLTDTPAPTIEHPGTKQKKAGPAGFGAIDPSWLPRRAYAGTYDENWEKHRRPLLPDDYDPMFGSSAPADQRALRHLRGGEPVELLGVTPEGSLRFQLPKVYLTYTTHFGSRREDHHGKMVTVLLLPDRKQVVLTWQSTLMVPAKNCDYLDVTHVREKAYLT